MKRLNIILAISTLFVSTSLWSATWVFETTKKLNTDETQILAKALGAKKLDRFHHSDEYFSRVYSVVSDAKPSHRLIKKVEKAPELRRMSLLPNENSELVLGEELFPYQWHLYNQEQTLLREQDDIHNLPLKGVRGVDIDLKSMLPVMKQEKKLIVAVLDTGVDIEHPDLKGHFLLNDAECGGDPNTDNDKNTLPGDCHGWNFTSAIDTAEAKVVVDRDGHGTHVAGIIAAQINNLGIAGVAPWVKILPVKVIRDSESDTAVATSEAFARGIMYAVDRGAKIVNLSLGWPRALETDFLRKSIAYALSHDVLLVAAAGNNNSNEPIFPCAYEGVICVGATTLNGKMAGFSNYGGHVDVVAPGEAILSTIPTSIDPYLFAVQGYDLKSGTSQAAPLTAGLIANMIGQESFLTRDDVLARLYRLPQVKEERKFALGGIARWSDLSKPIEGSLVRPLFKRFRQVIYRLGGPAPIAEIILKNYGLSTSTLKAELKSLNPAVTIDNSVFEFSDVGHGDEVSLKFPVSIINFLGESKFPLEIKLTSDDETRSFRVEVPVVRDIRQDQNFKRQTLTFVDKKLPIGVVANGEIRANMATISSYKSNARHEFFMKRLIKDGEFVKEMELAILRRDVNQFRQTEKSITLPNAMTLLNFFRADLNSDGVEDYFVFTLAQDKEGKKSFQFSFFNDKLEALWPAFQHISYVPDVFIQDLDDVRLMSFNHPQLGKMKIPSFVTVGEIAAADQVTSAWEKADRTRKQRLYYLEPSSDLKKLSLRTINHNKFDDKIRSELKLKWYETVELERVLATTSSDIDRGNIRALFSAGFNTKRKLFVMDFNSSTKRYADIPQLVLQTDFSEDLLKVTPEGLEISGDSMMNIYDRTRVKLLTIKDGSQETEWIYKHQAQTDIMLGHIASFEVNDQQIHMVQSRDEVITLSGKKKGKEFKVNSREKLRFSFLSQKALSEMYYPVVVKRSENLIPALYVDSSSITANRLSLMEFDEGKLVATFKNSIFVPSNCSAINPYFNTTAKIYEFVFVCLESNEWVVRTLPMN